MRLKVFLFVVAIGGLTISGFSQESWNWPDDKETAVEKNAMYTDALRLNSYGDAVEPLQWLLDNAPDLNESIYINGVKIYENLEKNEADAAKKGEYQEKVLELYDKRIEFFGNEGSVLNRKAYSAYKYYKNKRAKYKDLFDLYEKTYDLNGDKVGTNNLVAYMDVLRRYKASGGPLSDEDILDRYDKVMQIIDAKIARGESESKLNKNREFVDKLLTSMVKVDCEFITNKLGTKLAEGNDLVLAKKIMALSIAQNCTGEAVFLDAAKVVQEMEPTFGVAKIIGTNLSAAGNIDEAVTYFNQAIELTDENSKKAEIYYILALQYRQRGQKATAKRYALKTVETDGSRRDAYKLIGDLYFTSFNDCKKGENPVSDRAVYLAAFEMYQRAGDNKMMEAAREQFPSVTDIFQWNMEEGQSITIDCWFKETVTLQKRPS